MPFSNKITVHIIAELLASFEVEDIVISPGSRNAPFTIHFSEDERFNCLSVIDERSAAFVALGIAKKKQRPVVICCTSGSATVNYYPAITEAFYQNIPILIITADRPERLVDNFDGQTIRQKNIFQQHSYGNYQLTEDDSHEAITENFLTVKKAIVNCFHALGPVHINIPLSEPLYDTTTEKLFSIDELKIPKQEFEKPDFEALATLWNHSQRKLVLCGVLPKDEELEQFLTKLNEDKSVVLLCETTSNLHHQDFFKHIDRLIFNFDKELLTQLQPDLLLTLGQNVISKKIKDFLRRCNIKEHFHVDEYWQPNTYNHLTQSICYPKKEFLQLFIPYIKPKTSNYFQSWKELHTEKKIKHNEYIEKLPFCDLKVFSLLAEKIPSQTSIHFSNSSVIRYSQMFDFNTQHEIYCNRGVSGIEGCTSTAVGFSLFNEKLTLLVTGDIGFFYDSNALWNTAIHENFKIIILNNGGGNIFKIISPTSFSPSMEKYIETKHNLTAKHLAKMHNFSYFYAENELQFQKKINLFFQENHQSILEINTSALKNETFLKNYFLYQVPI